MKIKSLILGLAGLITSAAFAAQTQELPMIGSRAALRAYALSLITDVDASLYSNSGGSAYDYKTWVGQKSAPEIVDSVKGFTLATDTMDPSETIYVYIAARASTGDTLFYGNNQAKPVQVDGKWALPKEIGNVALNMNSVPIKVDKQVAYAVIVAKDANGNTQYYELASSGSTIYLSGDSAGLANAYLRILYADSTMASYDLADGKLKPTFPLSASLAAEFNNVVSFKDPAAKMSVVVKSDHGQGVVPTIEVKSSTAKIYDFDVATSDGKKPTVYWIKSGLGEWSSVSAASSVLQSISIPAGITYVVPEFSPADFTEVLQPVQTGGGEKG